MPFLRTRGQLQSHAHSRGRRETPYERKLSQIREADRLDARRAARIARSKKREAYELLRQPSEQEVEEARRPSVDETEVWVPDVVLSEEEQNQNQNKVLGKKGEQKESWDDELVKEDEVEKLWRVDEIVTGSGDHGKDDGQSLWQLVKLDELSSRKLKRSAEEVEESDHGSGGRPSWKGGKRPKVDTDEVSAIAVKGGEVGKIGGSQDIRELSVSNGSHVSPQPSDPSKSTTSEVANASVGTTTSTVIEAPSQNAIEQQEKEFLHSDLFPAAELRPARDFAEMMTTIAPIFGDSGVGWSKFGPQSPEQSTFFNSSSDESARSKVGPRQYNPNRAHGVIVGNSTDPRKRQYSRIVEPRLRTRHLEVDLLQRKISHGELMGLNNLRVDARRYAGDIAGASTGLVLWRLVRIAARVVIPGTVDEIHVAWYAILDRSCGGFF